MNRLEMIMYLTMCNVPYSVASHLTDEELSEHIDATTNSATRHYKLLFSETPEQAYEAYYKMRNRYEGRATNDRNWEPPAQLESKEWWDQPFAGRETE